MLKYIAGGYLAKALFLMVTDHLVIIPDSPVPGVDGIVKIDNAVFQGHDHGHQLEGRSGFCAFADGVIVCLMVESVRPDLKVGDSLYVTGFHLHHHRATVMGLVLRELLVECVFRSILKVKIDGGDDVVSGTGMHCLEVIDIDPCASCQSLLYLQPVLPGEVSIE